MTRSGGYANRARERGIQWPAVVLGWVVAVVAGIVIGLVLRGIYALIATTPVDPTEAGVAALILSVLTGFLGYLVGGYVAGKMARTGGGLNGAMTAVFGLIVGTVVAIIWVVLAVLFTGGEVPRAPIGLGPAGGAFLAGLSLFLVNLLGGYLGGKWGEPSRR